MKLEHKKEQVVSVNTFVKRLLKYVAFSGLLVGISLLIGTVGYRYSANLGWLDSFEMSSMILTGMGPTQILHSTGAKIFSSVYALYSGLAFLTITAVFLAPIVHRLMHILHLELEDEK